MKKDVWKWKKVKNRMIEKYGHRCMVCGYDLVVECDHVKPVSYGGKDTIDNAVLLCPNCHHLKNRIFVQSKKNSHGIEYPYPESRQHEVDKIKEYIEAKKNFRKYRIENPPEDLIKY